MKQIEEEKSQEEPAERAQEPEVEKNNSNDEHKTPAKGSKIAAHRPPLKAGSALKHSLQEGSLGSEDSLTDNENAYSPSPHKSAAGKALLVIQYDQRSGPRLYKNFTMGPNSLTFCVYGGNFPQVVRDALALRRNGAGQPIWLEVQPVTDTIMGIDFVWKPVNFVRQHGFDMMTKRVHMRPERPFAYCHFENISTLTSKSGLIRRLSDYYDNVQIFKHSGYSYESSMAFSFIAPTAEYISDNPELSKVRKFFHRFEKNNYSECRLPAR